MEAARSISSLVALALFAVASSEAQFLPQSHLGRLVQSIASPLVLAPNGGHYQDAAQAAAAAAAQAHYEPQEVQASAYYGHQQEGPHQPEASRHEQGYYQQPAMQPPQPMMQLQQAPSQQRGIPQQYYQHQHQHQQQQQQGQQYQGPAGEAEPQLQLQQQQPGQDDEPQNLEQYQRDQGAAHSHNHHRQQQRSQQQEQEAPLGYQMGAYLGPQIDDKEIQGAFNSNNAADDDDEQSSYGPQGGAPAGQGRHHKAASGHHQQQQPVASYDEEGADEEEPPSAPRPRRGGRPANGLSGAASQYRQRGSYQSSAAGAGLDLSGQGPTGQLVAAANGYAPFGYASGPVDLSGLMGGFGGPQQGGANQFQVYQGDGGGFGPAGYGPGYGPQQQQQRGRAQAAASNSYDGFDNPRDGFQAKNNDIDDNDADDD